MNTLIVDDEPVTTKMLKRLFSRYGMCEVATNGDDAVTFFKDAWHRDRPYDLIIMDVMMPGRTGIEAYEAIREYEQQSSVKKGSEVKIVLMTGMGISRELFNVYKTSCMAYLYKPVDMKELLEVLNRLNLPLSDDINLQSLK
ncbi:MAG: response regulator [Candidatus Magnetobacterium sp. LHC-1]|uniref:Response regulator n=1 Tax=Candidatus Magnetobacterium casense TaxID=1455061 RepID=A0ABS6RX40_9BACT|nr:response regulator [Candidatus Magnetobacterium casensis]MBF0607903.1 response regulator [Nitrospirota bacterium]MBV6341195.1 response regulator [Candidatus Magnetobacterium casensis]